MAVPEHHNLGKVIVTGGSGGFASQVLKLLPQWGSAALHSLDIREPATYLDGVTYHIADLTDKVSMRRILDEVKPDVVVHTASPRFDSPREVLFKVNVGGTRTLVQAAKDAGAKCFVYTSSASVISDAMTDLIGADETYPLIVGERQPEYYTHTKALAESYVLSQNRASDAPEFLTCAIRPSGIFGVGDLVTLPLMLDSLDKGATKFQLGSNQNLHDFTENTNVAYAHYLAAAALLRQHANASVLCSEEKVDGEAFIITNDEPRHFWDFVRTVWRYAGDQTRPDQIWTIQRPTALMIAGALEWVFWALRLGDPPLTRLKVRLSCMTRRFCIDKAKERLGYKPLVRLDEGLRVGVEDCLKRRLLEKDNGAEGQKQKSH
ncbi:C-3 sterol dehydrogenase/C-4 decarboxylase family protein [Polychaeton citri CBS 116435]|uniref:C-3 sterol dehydrogenase/C-4 decarboxylase family protein n=1 Tax=Polychaeton citri CBS 116435 TaxID=1314669 RepID=A0A9P4Q6Q8_9PEZI|nr:C-3 sterol dehydrogenase/C-4 decarboxylase family protein [Polychaeton citri CBS 116435]